MPRLSALRPGTRFRLTEMTEVTGVLVKVNECRAVVRLDRPERDVEFTDRDGQPRHFKSRGTHMTSWTPAVVVEVIGFEALNNEENDMSKAATKKAKSTKAKAKAIEKTLVNDPALGLVTKEPKGARKPKAAKAADGKLSCIDAAAKVLSASKEPMTTKAMIEAMAAKGLWSSPNGQTPSATLYSAILREINTKGKESRFKKSDRGLFAING